MLAKLTTPKGVLLLFAFLLSLPSFAQRRVDGKVTGPDGKPVYGATVTVKGTNVASTTSEDGSYSIMVPANTSVLVFSYVGYEVYEIDHKSGGVLDIVMKAQTTSLNEVVVTGYSSQRRKDITGAVAVVNVADLKSQPAADATSQLQGRASGVTVIQNGIPGSSAQVRIRGLGSFSNNNPLYVVDGVQTFSIAGLNPNDIESMQVLKDAASASVYGVRGTNGVIIITTKKGKKRGVNVAFDMYYGTQVPGDGFDLLNAQEEADLIFLARRNAALPTTGTVYGNGTNPVLPDYIFYSGAPNNGVPIMNGNPNVNPSLYQVDYSRLGDAGYAPYIIVPTSKQGTNWYKELTQNAPIQSYNATLSGMGESSRFMFSLNYFDQEAITRYQFYKRVTARMNSEFTVWKNVRIGENIQIYGTQANVPGNATTGDQNNNQEASVIAHTFRPMSTIPVYTIKDGDFAGTAGGWGYGTWGNAKNPVALVTRRQNNRNNNINIFGNVYGEVDFARHFTFRSSFGGNINTANEFTYPTIEYEHVENTANTTFTENWFRNWSWIWTNQLSFKKSFGNHDLAAVIGMESQKGGGRQVIGGATTFYSYNYQPFINLGNGTVQNLGGSAIYTPGTTLSYFGKVDYAYLGKYLVSGTIRRDASSKFLDPNKWGTFPAFSLGWRISDESFMKGIGWINDLKLRGSWGKMGNELPLSPANAFTTFASNRQSSWYDMTGTQNAPQEGFFMNFVGNAGGTWEKSVTSNIGFDATLFNNSTEVVLDWYTKKTEDLLYNPRAQGIMGGAAASNPAYRNVGSMKNSGLDLMIRNRSGITKDLRLTSTLTFTTYSNKVVSINGDQKYFDVNSPANEANRIGAPITRNILDQPFNTFFGYQVVGLFQSAADVTASPTQDGAAPGRFKYADINGDKKIDADDRTIIGNPNPDFTYGIDLALEYKNFDFSAFFYGVSGRDVFNLTRWWTDFSGGFPGGRSKRALYESWLPDGSRPNATTPIQEPTTNFSSSVTVNSYYVENGSYFRLRNLQIGYTLPLSVAGKAKMTKARVYVQAANLFTVTKYSGLNPEVVSNADGAAAIDNGNFPLVKQFLIGCNITF